MASDFPNTVYAIDETAAGDRSAFTFVSEPEIAASFDAERDRAPRPLAVELLKSPKALEVVAASLAGDPEQAVFRADEAMAALGALVEHFGGGDG